LEKVLLFVVVLICNFVLIEGCASSEQFIRNKRDEYFTTHKVNPRFKELIEQDKFCVGMSPYEVALARGGFLPDYPDSTDSNGYSSYSASIGIYKRYYRFKDDKLVDWWEVKNF